MSEIHMEDFMADMLLEVFCENVDCSLCVCCRCNSIDTLLLAYQINGLPTPESCSGAVPNKIWSEE